MRTTLQPTPPPTLMVAKTVGRMSASGMYCISTSWAAAAYDFITVIIEELQEIVGSM